MSPLDDRVEVLIRDARKLNGDIQKEIEAGLAVGLKDAFDIVKTIGREEAQQLANELITAHPRREAQIRQALAASLNDLAN
jgi:hypothetical protein